MIKTTRGEMEESSLHRILGFEDRPDMYVIWIEWRIPASEKVKAELVRRDAFPLPKETTEFVTTALGSTALSTLERTIEITDRENEIVIAVVWKQGDILVRRDANVILKKSSVTADAVAASLV